MDDIRLIQLARILRTEVLNVADARALLRARHLEFAAALFEEAAQNDDVLDAASALGYLDGRLQDFGDLVEADINGRVRIAFSERLAAWAV